MNSEDMGISLITKSKRSILSLIFSRLGLILILLILQVALMIAAFCWFEEFLPHIYGAAILFSAGMVLYLLNCRIDPTAKITWLVVIMLLPVFGALLFLYTQRDIGHRALKAKAELRVNQTRDALVQNSNTWEKLHAEAPELIGLAHYITRSGCYPVYQNTDITYFPLGEDKFSQMLRELKNAEHFIFMEYFIINEGLMWGQILEILAQKAAQGVEVRVMYDGTCELSTLPHDYPARLKKLGIQCKMFAPLSPFVSTHYNYRDHRKILVIDGHTAFTGGVNLADEYINRRERFGHWKDTAVMVKGDAVPSFTLMFLQMWSMDEKKDLDCGNYLKYDTHSIPNTSGFVIPYGDCPLDNDKVGEHVYIDILNRAQNYVHIMTPYLILDGEMEDALKYAAKRGVDIKIILPGIPDKYIPFSLALTHYKPLMECGIEIYEYTPGFVHAKSFVSDDREAVVGTINLDYRSLYHHFECAAYQYQTESVGDIEKDFKNTLLSCRKITDEVIKKEHFKRKALGILMKAVAPLL